MSHRFSLRALSITASFLAIGSALGQAHPDAPELSSRPGAAYTIYLNFSGFNYTGTWDGQTPGDVPAFSTDGDAASFNAGEIGAIQNVWAYTAQKYTAFDVNVTTIDPAVAAGRASSDLDRQNYYGDTARVMQTVIGGNGGWYGPYGGVSEVGSTQNPNEGQWHTNWVFPDNLGNSVKYIGEAASHENGHGLSLWHQHDEATGAEYSYGQANAGNGSYGPVMGAAYYTQRGAWRTGNSNVGFQNDVATLLSNDGIGGLTEDGIGHELAFATALPIIDHGAWAAPSVDPTRAAGVIVPKNGGANGPLGVDNYVSDYFAFATDGTTITLTVNDGTDFLASGIADPGATLDSTLEILDASGRVLATGTADSTTLKETYTGTLARGTYYARVASRGGYASSYEPDAPYFTMGSYFLTGSGGYTPVPEPATLAGIALGLGILARLRRRNH